LLRVYESVRCCQFRKPASIACECDPLLTGLAKSLEISTICCLFIPQVVARAGERGVARLLRYHDGKSLARGEFLVDLVVKHDEWVFVTDAWYFREGEAERWSKARYGEFRVQADGKALLVGLRGPNLERL
jgi:hypothetical protein